MRFFFFFFFFSLLSYDILNETVRRLYDVSEWADDGNAIRYDTKFEARDAKVSNTMIDAYAHYSNSNSTSS